MLITLFIVTTIISFLAGISCTYWLLENSLKKQVQNYEKKLCETKEKMRYQLEKKQVKIEVLAAEHQKNLTEKIKSEKQLQAQIKSLQAEQMQKLASTESEAQETIRKLIDKYSHQRIDLEKNYQQKIQKNNNFWQLEYHKKFQELEKNYQVKIKYITKSLQEKYQQKITSLENEHNLKLRKTVESLEAKYQKNLKKKLGN